jgi:hypothetical protein
VEFRELTMSPSKDEQTHLDDLESDCREALSRELKRLQDEEVRLLAKSKNFEERKANDPDAKDLPLESDLNAQLAKVQELAETYKSYMYEFTERGPASVGVQLNELNKILDKKSDLQSQSFLADDQKQKAELEQRLDQLSPRWLTYGFFGGFGFDAGRDLPRGPASPNPPGARLDLGVRANFGGGRPTPPPPRPPRSRF